jgi:hypothetical protein
MFFCVLPLAFLEQEGYARASDRPVMEHLLEVLEGMNVGGGWFIDGMNETVDYYAGYAWGYYGLWWAKLYGHTNPARAARWKTWAKEFLKDYAHFFAASGENPPFGRSMCYRFAASAPFAAEESANTGRLVPLAWLAALHTHPEIFFGRIIYTYSHDNSIMAVARGLVDAAAVDGLIWDYYEKKNPAFTSKTRIIKKSEPFGIPPLVASRQFPAAERERIQNLLVAMHQDPEGRRILGELMIDRFIPPRDKWYDTVRQMEQQLSRLKDKPDAPAKP